MLSITPVVADARDRRRVRIDEESDRGLRDKAQQHGVPVTHPTAPGDRHPQRPACPIRACHHDPLPDECLPSA
jgi:hypothetical protein